jgi:membrane-bound lytic murein transglycosylase C
MVINPAKQLTALAMILTVSLAGTMAVAQSASTVDQSSPNAETENNQSKGTKQKQNSNATEDLEKKFNQFSAAVEKEYTDFERAVKAAYDEVEKSLTPVWGKTETRLPEAKVWTGYSKDLKSRVIVDYQKGTVAIETVERRRPKQQPQPKQNKVLEKRLKDMLNADTAKLDQRDILAKATRKKLAEAKIKATTVPTLPRKKIKIKRELGELVDKRKKPVVTEREVVTSKGEKKIIKRIEMPMAANYVRKGAARYQTAILKHADRNKIERSLVLSIMKNESAFNPRARSHVPAYGLMQLVPRSGGADAMQEYLRRKGKKYSRKNRPSPDYLYQPKNNIELGSTYLYILYHRYLRRIKNPTSRIYCAIAAYNTGSGNVAKAFTGKFNVGAAARIINKMTPKQVYDHLIKKLPYAETQKYLYKVNRDRRLFRAWNTVKN